MYLYGKIDTCGESLKERWTFRHFGFGSGFPLFGNGGGDEVSLDDFFGGDEGGERQTQVKESDNAEDDDDEAANLPCGFLCSILKGLEDHINELEKDFQGPIL